MFFHHVLITTDLSDISNRAVEFIAKRIPENVEKITLLSVAENWPTTSFSGEPFANSTVVEEFNTKMIEAAKHGLHEVAKRSFPGGNVKCVALKSCFAAAKEICGFAQENKCDLIVIGSHGLGFLDNLILGSTVQKVLKSAPCPVMVIPNKD